jgi:hypothetical protein
MNAELKRPRGITFLIVINSIAAVITLLFWCLVYLRLFTRPIADPSLAISASATLGFLVGDLVWAVPLLIASVIGLRRQSLAGWLFSQLVNILWLYSMTVIWVRDLYSNAISPGAWLFTPFAIAAAWAIFYLWRKRQLFLAQWPV